VMVPVSPGSCPGRRSTPTSERLQRA
jgi:hypothetical protein